ncbi:MAG: DinB family protein [Bacteroidetes bacterium]|nr:DinB family protein [Bacteroidota bacterium]
MLITLPTPDQDFGFYNGYIQKAGTDDLVSSLEKNLQQLKDLVSPLTEEQLQFRYAPDKWSIKEILVHLVDSERTFNYRIMRASRGDQGVIPAFNITEFVLNSHASEKSVKNIMSEFELLRHATILMFEEMHPSMLEKVSPSRDIMVSVRGFGFAMVGHVNHHSQIIKERYFTAFAEERSLA